MNLVKNINPSIFREYDIRGIYNDDITEDIAYTLGRSFGSYISIQNKFKTVVGYDNRLSSPSLAEALIKGITESGVDVINVGLVTTPMYYFAKKHLNIESGIMITASHNPKEYNGFKLGFDKIGNAYGEYIYEFRDFTNKLEFTNGNGTEEKVDITDAYISKIKESIDLGNRKIKVVMDAGNGTGSVIVKRVLDEFPIDCKYIYADSDGNFPNHHPDPNQEENLTDLKNEVVSGNYDIGLALDGDADRIGVVDEKGTFIPPDLVMIIVYRDIVNNMKNKKALFDVKCSKALIDELEVLNIEPVMYRTGNSYTNMMMQKGDFDFGGEYSGHLFFRDKWIGTDDAIYDGLRLIEILSKTDKTVSELLEGINKYYSTPELKFKVDDEKKAEVVNKVLEYSNEKGYDCITIDGVRVTFPDSWGLVRMSNTGPNITARFEATTEARLDEIKEEYTKLLEELIN